MPECSFIPKSYSLFPFCSTIKLNPYLPFEYFIILVNTSSALIAERFTEDRTPPMLFAFDLAMTKGVNRHVLLRVQFTETIDLSFGKC